jgi:tellurium resistance protein TerD
MNYQNLKISVNWAESDTDIDIVAFMLDDDKWIPSEEFMVYFNNRNSADAALQHSGDDRFGGGEGETLRIDLSQVAEGIEEIMFVVCLHPQEGKINNFGHIPQAKLEILDETNQRVLMELNLTQSFPNETAIELARLYLRFGKWRFEDIQVGYKVDLAHFVNKFVY